ncbi:MAG: dTMP kinase [Saprospiraceae bacterium]
MNLADKRFIVFEGIDGCGKSTQAKRLTERLNLEGIPVHLTAEPSSRPIGKMIRDIFAHRMEADERTIAALFVADRLDHVINHEEGIRTKLEQGYTVICDRYYLSSYAYQGSLVPLDWVMKANALSIELAKPALHIFIDIPVELSMERISTSRTELEPYETHENLLRVRETYLQVIDQLKEKEHIVKIDGTQPVDWISKRVWEEVCRL